MTTRRADEKLQRLHPLADPRVNKVAEVIALFYVGRPLLVIARDPALGIRAVKRIQVAAHVIIDSLDDMP